MERVLAVRLRFVALVLFLTGSMAVWADELDIGLLYTSEEFEELEGGEGDPLLLYTLAIQENGGTRIALGQDEAPAKQQEKLATLEGLIIPGGIDVSPCYYGEVRHEKLEKIDGELDQFEFRVLAFALLRELPVLGICRGHQLMNVYFGGSLYQDIPSQVGPEVTHRKGKPPMHEVTLVPDSLMQTLFGSATLAVNSYHHQAVKDLAPGFRITARTADGVVEAIEAGDDRFLFGVQFHPEKLRAAHAQFNAPFERLMEEAEKWAATAANALVE